MMIKTLHTKLEIELDTNAEEERWESFSGKLGAEGG